MTNRHPRIDALAFNTFDEQAHSIEPLAFNTIDEQVHLLTSCAR